MAELGRHMRSFVIPIDAASIYHPHAIGFSDGIALLDLPNLLNPLS